MSLPEKLSIETPEQIPLEFTLAGIGSRSLALALDSLLQFGAYIILTATTLLLTGGPFPLWPSAWNWVAALRILIVFGLYYGYFAFFEILWNGQTPGKRYMCLRVISDTGRPITAIEAIIRNLLRVIDSLPGLYVVGIVSALFSSQNRRLGDYVAGTVVVHERPLEEAHPILDGAEQRRRIAHAITQLSAKEWQLIETFLHRRPFLEAEVRLAAARQIAERVMPKLGLHETDWSDPEKLLEALAGEYRAAARYRRL